MNKSAYTTDMSFFVRSTQAPAPHSSYASLISLFLAGLLVIMAVSQLFTFEDFPAVIAQMNLPGGDAYAPIRAALIVTLEIAALPFLLSMQLSPAARVVSMLSGWAAIIAWLAASIWTNIMAEDAVNSGLLGATIPLASEWWAVIFSLALGVMAAWVSWSMWPVGHKSEN